MIHFIFWGTQKGNHAGQGAGQGAGIERVTCAAETMRSSQLETSSDTWPSPCRRAWFSCRLVSATVQIESFCKN